MGFNSMIDFNHLKSPIWYNEKITRMGFFEKKRSFGFVLQNWPIYIPFSKYKYLHYQKSLKLGNIQI